jgi:hypothetical protein
MQTLDLVRRLTAEAPIDETFRNFVPALSPGADGDEELPGLKGSPSKARDKQKKAVTLDNVAQFREYSAWRAGVERARTPARPEKG